MLALHFLLRIEQPLIIPLETLLDTETLVKSVSSKKKYFNLEEDIRPVKNIQLTECQQLIKTKNSQGLGELFELFLKFYLDFDFRKQITLSSAKPVSEDSRAVFIENPFYAGLNAAPNVSPREIDKFKRCCEKTLANINQLRRDNTRHVDIFKLIQRTSEQNSKSKKF